MAAAGCLAWLACGAAVVWTQGIDSELASDWQMRARELPFVPLFEDGDRVASAITDAVEAQAFGSSWDGHKAPQLQWTLPLSASSTLLHGRSRRAAHRPLGNLTVCTIDRVPDLDSATFNAMYRDKKPVIFGRPYSDPRRPTDGSSRQGLMGTAFKVGRGRGRRQQVHGFSLLVSHRHTHTRARAHLFSHPAPTPPPTPPTHTHTRTHSQISTDAQCRKATKRSRLLRDGVRKPVMLFSSSGQALFQPKVWTLDGFLEFQDKQPINFTSNGLCTQQGDSGARVWQRCWCQGDSFFYRHHHHHHFGF